jgi:ABC-2 type transport system permease protein
MHNMFLIARREYLERVRSKSFLFMTIFIPALMFGAAVLPTLLITKVHGGVKHLVLATADPKIGESIREELEKTAQKDDLFKPRANQRSASPGSSFSVEVDTNVSEAERAVLAEKVTQKKIDGVIWATPEALASRKMDFITRDTSSFIDNISIQQAVGTALRRHSLKSKGLTDQDIASAMQPVDLTARSPLGVGATDPQATFLTVLLMAMVLYMTMLLYGINVMRAVLEEKTSRIMEVMLSTATAKEMMGGKIMGVGAVGLTQVGIWATAAGVFSAGPLAAAAASLKNIISLKMGISFALFFLLGYALYSTLCAAVGSMVNSEQEAQQMQFFVMMPMIMSAIVLVYIIQFPGTPLSFWASVFPLTAPLIMFTRIALDPNNVPFWQIALSVGLLLATIYGVLILCGRIYRIGILMYGKKPTLPEIMKWIKYA